MSSDDKKSIFDLIEEKKFSIIQERLLSISDEDLARVDSDGKTALYVAAQNGHEDIVTDLLNAGAEIDEKDNDGKYILQVATDSVKMKLQAERILRCFPAHLLARNGDLN
ncbi:hypothetical protein AC1031_004871 [Aphanomyces cochlioides]|nr:hypothetical protein AC1031_004871 [Aphanomyces cochlioides]